MGPEEAAPSILDYRPRSTLVAPTHLVAKARYPAIDFHGHPQALLGSVESLAAPRFGPRRAQRADDDRGEQHVGRRPQAHDRDDQRVAGDEGSRARAGGNQLSERWTGHGPSARWRSSRRTWRRERWASAKSQRIFGQTIRKADGSRLKLDDPDLDPIWQAAARLRLPVFIHTGDPQEFYQKVDYNNERWLELELFRDVASILRDIRLRGADEGARQSVPPESEDDLRRRAHGLARERSRPPRQDDDGDAQSVRDVGAVLYDIGAPSRARRTTSSSSSRTGFFSGRTHTSPRSIRTIGAVFETNDDYFDYYRHYHAFWKLYGIDLPDDVLKKVYYKNALAITPRLPQTGWPR